ncbi:hypothetical protein JHK86_027398 [Glycine max]|nr:hypothetical protein JHK86_027398 [Glycine max]
MFNQMDASPVKALPLPQVDDPDRVSWKFTTSEHFESEWHVFVACSKAREMWTAAGIHYLLEQKFNEAEGIKELM